MIDNVCYGRPSKVEVPKDPSSSQDETEVRLNRPSIGRQRYKYSYIWYNRLELNRIKKSVEILLEYFSLTFPIDFHQ